MAFAFAKMDTLVNTVTLAQHWCQMDAQSCRLFRVALEM
jgi:hypothetical protein